MHRPWSAAAVGRWGLCSSTHVIFTPLHVWAGIYRPPGCSACATLKTAGATLLFNHLPSRGEGAPGPVCQRPFPRPPSPSPFPTAAAHTHTHTTPQKRIAGGFGSIVESAGLTLPSIMPSCFLNRGPCKTLQQRSVAASGLLGGYNPNHPAGRFSRRRPHTWASLVSIVCFLCIEISLHVRAKRLLPRQQGSSACRCSALLPTRISGEARVASRRPRAAIPLAVPSLVFLSLQPSVDGSTAPRRQTTSFSAPASRLFSCSVAPTCPEKRDSEGGWTGTPPCRRWEH